MVIMKKRVTKVIAAASMAALTALQCTVTVFADVPVGTDENVPAVTEVTVPDVTEPDITEPDVTDPDVTEPDVTEPDVTEPDVTEPDVTEPDVTEPDVTEPDVTEPDVTEPDVTEPDVTEPDVTEPDETETVETTDDTAKTGKSAEEKLQERLAKLSGGVAVIKVGAATEVEMKEKKLRIEDALAATKAAVEEGIVAGGGTALINAMPAVSKLTSSLQGDEKTGAQIVLKALEEPVRQIAKNAGLEGSVIIDKIIRSRKVGYGFDAYNETYVDMIPAGIVDPTKVTRSALQNAASVAAMVLTTESLVADIKEETPAAPAGAGMGGMGGMY